MCASGNDVLVKLATRLPIDVAFQMRLLTNVHDAITATDENDNIIYWNGMAEALFGWKADEAIGQHVAGIFKTVAPGSSRDKAIEEMLNDDFYEGEIIYHHKDGHRIYAHVHTSVLRSSQGDFKGTISTIRDVSERKKAEEALKENQCQLLAELEDARLLQSISNELLNEGNIQVLSEKITDAAKRMMRSDFASLQIFHPERGNGGELQLAIHRGFDRQAAEYWEWVDISNGTSCAAALRTRQRVIVPDVNECDFIKCADDYALFQQAGVRAVQTTPLISRRGQLLGMFSTHWRKPHQPSERDLVKLDVLARQASDLIERSQAEEALRDRQEQLARELSDMKLLQTISTELVFEDNSQILYDKITDAASKIMHSEYASLQMHHPDCGSGGTLELLAYCGFNPKAAEFWKSVDMTSGSTCGEAFRTGQRVIVSDVETCDFMKGTEDQATYLQTGIHAVQTTPLFSRSGKLVGMISTHWRSVYHPTERELSLLDVLARLASDLIERKQAEQRLRESEARALDLVSKLEEANRNKNRFISVLSHELRNPLATIVMAQALIKQLPEGSEKAKRTQAMQERQTAILTRMVEDLLDVTRISEDKIQLKPERLDLVELVRQTTSDIVSAYDDKGIELHVVLPNDPIYVEGDPVRLAQSVGNLLHNALKFSPSGSTVTVEASIDASSDEVVVRVVDHGTGLEPEALENIFQPFTQADQELARTQGGLGLGLSIVRGMVELHGGHVDAQSEGLGKGATFTIRLPLQP